MNTLVLVLIHLDVASFGAAGSAMKKIQAAIDKVSTQRSTSWCSSEQTWAYNQQPWYNKLRILSQLNHVSVIQIWLRDGTVLSYFYHPAGKVSLCLLRQSNETQGMYFHWGFSNIDYSVYYDKATHFWVALFNSLDGAYMERNMIENRWFYWEMIYCDFNEATEAYRRNCSIDTKTIYEVTF